jgi:hypothetical protein
LPDVALKKLIKIIGVIMAAFMLASLCLYRMQFQPRRPAAAPAFETRLAQGQISEIDNDAKTLLLVNDRQLLLFSFDDKTAVSGAGHFVEPQTIASGTKVTVTYWRTGERNWAKEILLMPEPGAGRVEPEEH